MQESDLKRRAPWEEIFFREAFFLYEHRAAVYADSRMFFSPLPFKNNLAYSGSSGLDNATLGIYLKWWDSCERLKVRYFRAFANDSGRQTFSSPCASLNRGAISLSRNPAMPQPMRVT